MPKNKQYSVFFPLLFSLVLALGMYLGFKLRDAAGSHYNILFHNVESGSIQQILDLIDVKYVDTVDRSKLQDEAISGILAHLDPHSIYIPPQDLEEVNDNLEGGFEGIGVEFMMIMDTVSITSVLPGGPSEAAGLQQGDQIIKVNDSLISGVHTSIERIKVLLRGSGGTMAGLIIRRNGKLLEFSIRRGMIPIVSIDASYMITPDMGYIRINRFANNTYQEFMQAITRLKSSGMKKLIIDLRDNPGGFLEAATSIADELLDDHKLIVYTQGKSFPRTDYYCQKPGVFEQGKLAILVDEGSASASEILSGAIQDWDRGTIIGRRTFGKGLVQEQYPLQDGGALRLTVARYYIPSGRCIQKSYNKGFSAYEDDILNRYHHGEFENADSIRIADTTRYRTLVKGRIVYGGGGITPDIFIPFDTTMMGGVLGQIYTRGTLNDFTYRFYSQHRALFASYQSLQKFNSEFQVPDSFMKAFTNFAERDSIYTIHHLNVTETKDIQARMKALFARDIWRDVGYYLVSNTSDPAVQRAIKELGN